MTEFKFVDLPSTITTDLEAAERIAVDTEFLREKTFLAQLCLVQIATDESIYCVDPLSDGDLAAFWSAACEPEWILHSGRQDIEVVYQSAHRMPREIFDTQIAAGLLGYAPQMGYANLVDELFDVKLPKTHTRADWSQRPLPDALLEYAADDVEYLLKAYETLAERLQKLGRLEWAEEDSALLLDPALYDINPEEAVGRLKGARNLRGSRRAIAVKLAAWREEEALKRDRPRQWILRDNALIDLACQQPGSVSAMRRIESMPNKLIDRAGESLLSLISNAAEESSSYRPPTAPDEQQKALLKELQGIVAGAAKGLGISAEIVASKRELSAAVLNGRFDSRVFGGWRRDVAGEKLERKIAG